MKPSFPAKGARVRCLFMNDPQAVPSGTLGVVTGCTDMGSWILIAVSWDNRSTLALAVPPDRFEIVSWPADERAREPGAEGTQG